MTHPDYPTSSLQAHTLDSLCVELVSGRGIGIADGPTELRLKSEDARLVFDWYRLHRDKWAKNVFKEDVESIVDQLDKEAPELPEVSTSRGSTRNHILYIKSVIVRRFAGVHRYGDGNQQPPEFTFDFTGRLSLIEGPNGTGKTSLLNTILWCLTGLVMRSQGPPESGAQEIPVSVWEHDGTSICTNMTPITPLPPDDVVRRLAGKELPLNTFVEITFTDAQGNDAGKVSRGLHRGRNDTIVCAEPDFSRLNLDPIAREIGTKMPALIPHIRLETSSDLGKAVAALIGIKPLLDLARHAEKAKAKLELDLVKDREKEIVSLDASFIRLREELQKLLEEHRSITPPMDLPLPSQVDVEDRLASLVKHFEDLKSRTLENAKESFGGSFDPNDRCACEDLEKQVGPARGQMERTQLRQLESAKRLSVLGKIPESDLAKAEALVAATVKESEHLDLVEKQPDDARRLRLYAHIASWSRDHRDPEHSFDSCPVCQSALAGKVDTITGRPIVDHLRESLQGNSDLVSQTLQKWAKGAHLRLKNDVHESLQAEVQRDLPEKPIDLITAAFSKELFDAPCFRGVLAGLKPSAATLCEKATATLPPFDEPNVPTLSPKLGSIGKPIGQTFGRIMRAIAFARWRQTHEQACKAAFVAIFGGEEVNGDSPPSAEKTLPARLADLEQLVKSASPLREALLKINAMSAAFQDRKNKLNRIAQYARTAKALAELSVLPGVVEEQIAFLTNTLAEGTTKWKDRLYQSAYRGAPYAKGPKVETDGSISIDAEAEGSWAPARHISNASELRATLFAFLLAFWDYLLETRGGLAVFLLDDPQQLFDPSNRRRIANSLPAMAGTDRQVIVTTSDPQFGRQTAAAAIRQSMGSEFDRRRIHPPKSIRPHIVLGPFAETVEEKRRDFEAPANENDDVTSRDYINELRIYVENRLSDFFDFPEAGLPKQPTLGDLFGALRRRVNNGVEPFATRAFSELVNDQTVVDNSEFLNLLNQSHHGAANLIRYRDVWSVRADCQRIRELISVAHVDYELWLRRDAREPFGAMPEPPPTISFPKVEVPVYEDLSAATADLGPAELSSETDQFSMEPFTHHCLFVLNSHNFGFAAGMNCRAIVDMSDTPIADNGLVIALHGNRVYARRLIRGTRLPGPVVLSSEAENPLKRAPSITLPAEEVRLLKVVGILFDDRPHHGRSKEEACLVDDATYLERAMFAFRVRGSSALPLALEGQILLGGSLINAHQIGSLVGTLIAAVTTEGAVFKRIGQSFPGAGHVRQLESIGGRGESMFVRTEEVDDDGYSEVPLLTAACPILGVIYS